MPRNSISISLDASAADQDIRQGAEELARQHGTTLSAIGRAALSAAIDAPHLLESRLSKRWPGRRLEPRT